MIFKNSVRTAKKTLHFTITKINWLTLFKEIIAVCNENHTRYINTKWRVIDCWSWCGTYLPFDFKGLMLTTINLETHTFKFPTPCSYTAKADLLNIPLQDTSQMHVCRRGQSIRDHIDQPSTMDQIVNLKIWRRPVRRNCNMDMIFCKSDEQQT
jgi:hypothetical protein